jgi:tetratricopeptide (TPR) repeat protein
MRYAKTFQGRYSFLLRGGCLSILCLCVSLMAGCATPYGAERDAEQVKNAVDVLYKNADAELARGDREKAVSLLNEAASKDPANADPWLKIADIRFAASDYPASILAANEALQRDPVNQKAKSILVVAGLRIAASAVNGLKESGAIAVSERVQAQNLTNNLRDILGEKVLVPPAAAADEKPVARRPRKSVRSHHAPAVSTPARASSASAESSDPFKSLK